MPPDRLAAVLAARQRRAVATGTEMPDEIAQSPDIMGTILTSLDAGDGEQACKMAMRWCATQKGMCDDEELWQELRVRIFPQTRNSLQPVFAKKIGEEVVLHAVPWTGGGACKASGNTSQLDHGPESKGRGHDRGCLGRQQPERDSAMGLPPQRPSTGPRV